MTSAFAVSTAMPRDYFELLKPRVMQLVVFTAIAGLLIAPGSINPADRPDCHRVYCRWGRGLGRTQHVV